MTAGTSISYTNIFIKNKIIKIPHKIENFLLKSFLYFKVLALLILFINFLKEFYEKDFATLKLLKVKKIRGG
jgi:hypothetical protein